MKNYHIKQWYNMFSWSSECKKPIVEWMRWWQVFRWFNNCRYIRSYQVSELALKCNVSKDTVRYYAKINLLRPRRNPGNGYHCFTEQDIKRLEFIKMAKYLGYTLKDIKHILDESQKGSSPCPRVRDRFCRKN